jgi:hypothetical protein
MCHTSYSAFCHPQNILLLKAAPHASGIVVVEVLGLAFDSVVLLLLLLTRFLQARSEDMHDVLHLAMNSGNGRVISRVCDALHELRTAELQLPDDEALALLHTAVERQQVGMFRYITSELSA